MSDEVYRDASRMVAAAIRSNGGRLTAREDATITAQVIVRQVIDRQVIVRMLREVQIELESCGIEAGRVFLLVERIDDIAAEYKSISSDIKDIFKEIDSARFGIKVSPGLKTDTESSGITTTGDSPL